MPENARVLLNIYGRVQGVFFRAETLKQANKLALTGWVQNNNNGTVQAIAEGDKQSIDQLISWCEEGSSAAAVDKVDVSWLPYTGEFKEFIIKY